MKTQRYRSVGVLEKLKELRGSGEWHAVEVNPGQYTLGCVRILYFIPGRKENYQRVGFFHF